MLFEQEFAVQRYGNRMKEEGRVEEQKASAERDRRRVLRMFERGASPEKIAEDMELSIEQIREWISQ